LLIRFVFVFLSIHIVPYLRNHLLTSQ
jgi:hypothetical protein